jgi:protein-S-isoprenylcysteine O-methyltransferase Ste14
MNLIGNATINPIMFYSGKISGYILWVLLLLNLLGLNPYNGYQSTALQVISMGILAMGSTLGIKSMFDLGKSLRLGLPTEETSLKHVGLYKLSRNPMYVGFDLLTIAAMLYKVNMVICTLGAFSLLTYHLIILGEEKFLGQRFGNEYVSYKKLVRRYL